MFCFRKLLIIHLFLPFIFLFSVSSIAQNSTIDSLKKELMVAKHDTTRVKIYNSLSEICDIKDIPLFCEKGITLCNKHKNDPLVYNNYLCMFLSNMAFYHDFTGSVNKSIEFNYQALKISDSLKDKKIKASILYNIGKVFIKQNNYIKASSFINNAKRIALNIKNKDLEALCYDALAEIALYKQEYDSAIIYSKISLFNKEIRGDTIGILSNLNNLASAYQYQNDLSKADVYYQKVIDISSMIKDSINLCIALNNKGDFFFKKKNDFLGAEISFLRALKIAKNINNPAFVEIISGSLGVLYQKKNNYKKALEYITFSIKLKDSLNNEQIQKQSIEKDIQYEYNKKELANKLKQEAQLNATKLEAQKKDNQKNTLLVGLASILVVIVLSVVFWYRNNKQKQSIRELEKNELKQKVLLSQMSPHFIFNSISNIKGLIRNKDDERAMTYLDEFSLLTRQVLEHSRENYISIEEEISMITNYLNIQQLLLNNSFVYELKVSENINREAVFIPPMIVQPFIENAIKHGIDPLKENSKITISFFLDDTKKLIVSVEDNGRGFSTKSNNTNHKSLALKITQQRLEQYGQLESNNISFENKLNQTGEIEGVKVCFEMPYIYEK